MWFQRNRPDNSSTHTASTVGNGCQTAVRQKRVTTAETAHLIGPGHVKLEGGVPIWQPVEGGRLQLHPEYLQRVACYGNVDFSTAVLRQLWRRQIQVVFLSPAGHRLLGKLAPGGSSPDLSRQQHLAAADSAFCLKLARETVSEKIESCAQLLRYFQQQGKAAKARPVLRQLRTLGKRAIRAQNRSVLRGIEGAAAAAWFGYLPNLLPGGWQFAGRVTRPPTDPVNSLLSLGYSLLQHRCETMLAAADFDPRVGFLHDLRPGRSSLACDLVEPFRAPLVDRLVIRILAKRVLTEDSFRRGEQSCHLTREAFKKFLTQFEQTFVDGGSSTSFQGQIVQRMEQWRTEIRNFVAG